MGYEEIVSKMFDFPQNYTNEYMHVFNFMVTSIFYRGILERIIKSFGDHIIVIF